MSENISGTIEHLEGQVQWAAFGNSIVDHAVFENLPGWLHDKGFRKPAIDGLAKEGLLGDMLDASLLGNVSSIRGQHDYAGSADDRYADARRRYLNNLVAQSFASYDPSRSSVAYQGLPEDNANIIDAYTNASRDHESRYDYRTQRQYRRNGTSRNLWLPDVYNLGNVEKGKAERIASVPIAIIGAGASGVLEAAFLSQMGFTNITIFDKRGRTNGLWQQENVREGSKNNPFDIRFEGASAVAATRDVVEQSGRKIDEFIDDVRHSYHVEDTVTLRKASIKEVEPGDLEHRITFVEDGETKTEIFPIVIYAPGIGNPLDPNDDSRMTTPMKKNEVGQRWQRQLYKPGEIEKLGKRVVLVGLGNSTAEVVYQLQQSHPDVDYRIITHLPYRSIQDPSRSNDTHPAVYRDVRKPELTRLAGDLPHIDAMFRHARENRKIVTDVTDWSHDGNVLRARDNEGIETHIPFDTLFTLIGYGQDPAVNSKMGLVTADERTGSIYYDIDGEIQREAKGGDFDILNNPRERVYPGYFALGPILKNGYNPNAIVIPGIQFQIQLMAGTILARAAEVAFSKAKTTKAR